MLFRHECKKIVCSAAFIVYCVLSLLFFFANYWPDCSDEVSCSGQGLIAVEDHDRIMDGATNSLMGDFASNRYECYPYGFYKAVHLKEKKREKVRSYLEEITGVSGEDFDKLLETGDTYYEGFSTKELYQFHDIPVKEGFSYDRFVEIMADVDDIVGGGSIYNPEGLMYSFSLVPMAEEDIKAEQDSFYKEDKITRGLARLFCDYAGICLAILPVFTAAWLTAADKKRRMQELVYTRDISSLRLVLTRYGALLFTMAIPVLAMMILSLIQALVVYKGHSMDMLAFFKLPVVWLLPNLMFTTAVGVLLTEIFSSPVAILSQLAIWFYSVMAGSMQLSGNLSRFALVPRHNTPFERGVFLAEQNEFIFSRVFWTVISLVLMLLAVAVYSAKRGGRFNGIRLFGKDSIFRRKA